MHREGERLTIAHRFKVRLVCDESTPIRQEHHPWMFQTCPGEGNLVLGYCWTIASLPSTPSGETATASSAKYAR